MVINKEEEKDSLEMLEKQKIIIVCFGNILTAFETTRLPSTVSGSNEIDDGSLKQHKSCQ